MMNIKNLEANYNFDGDILVIATVSKTEPVQDILDKFKPDKFDLFIKPKLRSLDANAKCWTLLKNLADKLETTDKDLYREFIRDHGAMQIIPIKDEAVDWLIKKWESTSKSGGWICENLGACRNTKGYSNIKCYFGTSVYDSKEMWIFLNWIIDACKDADVETLSPKELERLKIEIDKRK